MTTYYLDPIGGNDANAGTSFATRWQTITSGATAARIAPGDTIRVIASPAPTSLGQNATWTDGSRTVTLTSAVTATITDATAAWTAVTNTSSSTNTWRKLDSTSSSLTVDAAFTTGKSHYTTVSTANLSGYQQITFWIMQTAGTLASADGEISLKLCSDAAGATAVNTFNVPRIRALNVWQAYTIDLATNLGSSIQSIGFYVNTDRGAQTFLVNNIQAVKAASSADSLSLTSLIGKNSGTEGWFSIDSISGTSVVLRTAGNGFSNASGTPSGYAGTTASVTTYKREPLHLASANVAATSNDTSFGAVQDSGSAGSPITFSGGWDRTAMSTQTGDTYINGVNGQGYALYVAGKSYVSFEKINPFNFMVGAWIDGTTNNVVFAAKDVSCNNDTNIFFQNASAGTQGPSLCTFTVDNVNCAGTSGGGANIYLYRSAKNCKFTVVNSNSAWNYGLFTYYDGGTSNPFVITQIDVSITNARRNGTNGVQLNNLDRSRITLDSATDNAGFDFNARKIGVGSIVSNNTIKITSSITRGAFQYGYGNTLVLSGATLLNSFGLYVIGENLTVIGGTFSGTTTANVEVDGGASVTLIGSTLNSPDKYYFDEAGSSSIKFQKYQNTANDHRQYFTYGSILTDTATRHTASGISWKISPTSTDYVTSDFPMVLPIGKVAVASGSLVTASVWVNRDNTGLSTKLVCRGGQIAGVSSDVVDTASGSASTWEQLTITFTPSEAGVVDLEVQAYGGTTYSVYVDDLDVAQA